MNQQNEKTTKWITKVFWAWQDEKEEQWLEQQAAQGWHLVSVAPFRYQLLKGTPRQVLYRLDYKITSNKDYPEYQELFRDSGWELVARMSNWHYYRIEPANQQVPELYSSNRTKAQKYRRLLAGLCPVFITLAVVFNPSLMRSASIRQGFFGVIYQISHIFLALILIFLVYGLIRILLKIRQLESNVKE